MQKIKNFIKRRPFLHKFILDTLFFFSKKGELRRFIHFLTRGHFFAKLNVSKYVKLSNKNNLPVKLQVGGGYHTKKDWLNGDFLTGEIYLNAAKTFPIKSDSFDYIFSEHFLEHLDFSQGRIHLKEAYRVMKKGAKIRIGTPDLEKLVQLYNNKNEFCTQKQAVERHFRFFDKKNPLFGEFFNDMFHMWSHQFIYDFETLKACLQEAGFTNVTRFLFAESDTKEFKNVEVHADSEWMKNGFTLIVEAEKE